MRDTQILGVILLVLGILLAVGFIDIPYIGLLMALGLLGYGIFVLAKKTKTKNNQVIGWICVGLGLVLVVINSVNQFSDIESTLARTANLIVGLLIAVIGVVKIVGKN